MPSGFSRKQFAKGACVALLLILLPSCKFGGGETDYGRYGLYRIMAFDRCTKSEGDKKATRQWSSGSGTAFLINDRNLVATNRHVVEVCQNQRAPYIFIVSFKDDSKDEGKLVRADIKKIVSGETNKVWQEDLALLQPRSPLSGEPWPIATYDADTGAQVRALGFPDAADLSMDARINNKALSVAQEALRQGSIKKEDAEELFVNTWIDEYKNEMKSHREEFRPTFTEGVVSRALVIDEVPVVQHQAPIGHGSSGGPLLDSCGNVIGINTYGVPGSALATSLGGKWVAEQISAAGFDVIQKNGRCFAARFDNRITPITIALAILLSSALLFFVFRKSLWGQGGFKPASPKGAEGGIHDGTASAPLSNGTAPVGETGASEYLRLIPVSAGTPLTLPAGRVSYIGRDPGADGVIADSSVSRRHARINLDGAGRITIEDAGSANGTWKNGAKISRETFAAGDVVRFGNVEYRIEIQTDEAGGHRATELLPGTHGEQQLKLSGVGGDGQAIEFSLQPSAVERTWTIGRKTGDVDLVVPNLRISSIHARIRYRPGRGFEICDLGSSNGTKIDGRYVDREYISLEGVRKITLGELDLNVKRG